MPWASAHALPLTYVSDLITTSAPSADASHTIQFTATQAIPASGHIVITPQAGAFTIPAGLNYTDVDLSVSSGGPYIDRDLAASADATNDGISVSTGSSGSITITLNSSTGIAAGELVRVEIGTVATHGVSGDALITNPSTVTSYRLTIVTSDVGSTQIDIGVPMIAIINQVSVTAVQEAFEANLSNGLPSGALAAGNDTIEISFNTDRPATCRYATSSGVVYGSMTGTINKISTFFYSKVIAGHANNTTYNYYIRCLTDAGVANANDYLISFSLAVDPISNSSIVPQSAFLGRGGQGEFPSGSSVLYTASVTMQGWALPGSKVTLLRDGKIAATTQAKADGSFSGTINAIERGTYTFQSYFEDPSGLRSGSYTQTLALGSGSNNILSNIVIPPTAVLKESSINIGNTAEVSGSSILNGTIELFVQKQGVGATPASIQTFTSTTSPSGQWRIVIPGNKFQKGSYTIKARAILNAQARSPYGKLLFLGVGQDANADLSLRADINRDGKVNLIDFSIMLSHWGTSDADSDINQDDTVNLADFSILLFNWTG